MSNMTPSSTAPEDALRKFMRDNSVYTIDSYKPVVIGQEQLLCLVVDSLLMLFESSDDETRARAKPLLVVLEHARSIVGQADRQRIHSAMARLQQQLNQLDAK